MNICMFFPIFPPRYGGGTRQALMLAEALREKGIDIFFVALTDEGEQSGKGIFNGFEVYYIPVKDLDIYIESGSSLLEKISLIIKLFSRFISLRGRYSIIHIQGLAYPYTTLGILARVLKRKTIAKTSMLKEANFADCGRIFGRISRSGALRIDRIAAISSMIRRRLIGEDFEESRVLFIPNCVDVEHFRPAGPEGKADLKSTLGISERLVITFIGGITYRKGADRIVSMWPSVHREHPDSRLILIGPRSREEGAAGDRFCYLEIREEIKGQTFENSIEFTGRVDNVADYLQVSDLFVFPSGMEGMPNVLLEAMACGVPTVSYRVSGIADIITDGSDGIIIEPGDEDTFRKEVIDILADSGRRRNFSLRARDKIVEKFSLDHVSDCYIEVYKSLLTD